MVALVLVVVISAWWATTLNARERAKDFAGRFCRLNDWQLLDQTVSLYRSQLQSTSDGLRLLRVYRFEFSTDGANRHRGYLHMLGKDLGDIHTDKILAPSDTSQLGP